jgi:hypothetical protein
MWLEIVGIIFTLHYAKFPYWSAPTRNSHNFLLHRLNFMTFTCLALQDTPQNKRLINFLDKKFLSNGML